MDEYATEAARKAFSDLLDATQWRAEHVAISRYRRRIAVLVDPAWYAQARAAVAEEPDVVDAPCVVERARAALARLLKQVEHERKHVRFTRHGELAGVLLPTPWYEKALSQVGALASGPVEPETPSDGC